MEMLVVLGILAILLAHGGSPHPGHAEEGRHLGRQIANQDTQQILAHYSMDMKEFPSTEQGLKALVKKPADLSEAQGQTVGRPLYGKRRVAQGSVGQRFHVRVSAQARHHAIIPTSGRWAPTARTAPKTTSSVGARKVRTRMAAAGGESAAARPAARRPRRARNSRCAAVLLTNRGHP